MTDIYMHGQILGTHSFYLKNGFLEPGAKRRWAMPKEEDIKNAKVIGIDPFFLEATQSAAELCI